MTATYPCWIQALKPYLGNWSYCRSITVLHTMIVWCIFSSQLLITRPDADGEGSSR